jgi:hypothetical protein
MKTQETLPARPPMSEGEIVEKWLWKMDYCKKKKFPPAQAWAWDLAEVAFNDLLDTKQE